MDTKEEIYGLRLGGKAKAWPAARVVQERVILDRLGDVDLVLVGDPESGSVRAYRREGRMFQAGASPSELRDETGRVWTITEENLVPRGDGVSRLPRVPGVVAFWFGWYGFFPQTEVYRPSPGISSRWGRGESSTSEKRVSTRNVSPQMAWP